MSKFRLSFFCFSNFLAQSPQFTGLQLNPKAVKVTVKNITSGLAYILTLDPQGMVACLLMFSRFFGKDRSVKRPNRLDITQNLKKKS
ncbi:hypothetical protein Hanom_Chr17g01569381 [Helianthus anomalus]